MAILGTGSQGAAQGVLVGGNSVQWVATSLDGYTNYSIHDTNDGTDGDGVINVGDAVYIYQADIYYGASMTYMGVNDSTGDSLFYYSGDNSVYVFPQTSDAITGYYNNAILNNTIDTYSATSATYCFLSGTLITTPNGTTNVESLHIGDEVITTEGVVQKVKWVGVQNCHKFTLPTNKLPVIVRKEALGENIPSEDLYLSSDHALYVDGVLAHAGALVNDISIVRINRDELESTFTYYHVELEDHSLILANNTPAETFV
ncbi:Hint domain-containing protein, partial [Sulfuricurvum sp.]|uniref:Hint domain-containing protein n=1 Tax=Sulfuricurvum sp. TaxID=2025608 RepID=UPI00262C2B57